MSKPDVWAEFLSSVEDIKKMDTEQLAAFKERLTQIFEQQKSKVEQTVREREKLRTKEGAAFELSLAEREIAFISAIEAREEEIKSQSALERILSDKRKRDLDIQEERNKQEALGRTFQREQTRTEMKEEQEQLRAAAAERIAQRQKEIEERRKALSSTGASSSTNIEGFSGSFGKDFGK